MNAVVRKEKVAEHIEAERAEREAEHKRRADEARAAITAPFGQLVAFVQPDNESARNANRTRIHPAIVTSVHPDGTVNLTVFYDMAQPAVRTQVARVELGAPTSWPGGWLPLDDVKL